MRRARTYSHRKRWCFVVIWGPVWARNWAWWANSLRLDSNFCFLEGVKLCADRSRLHTPNVLLVLPDILELVPSTSFCMRARKDTRIRLPGPFHPHQRPLLPLSAYLLLYSCFTALLLCYKQTDLQHSHLLATLAPTAASIRLPEFGLNFTTFVVHCELPPTCCVRHRYVGEAFCKVVKSRHATALHLQAKGNCWPQSERERDRESEREGGRAA
jgi:hypothetical protein